MKRTTRTALAPLIALALFGSAPDAPANLGQIATENGAGWLIGEWENDDGAALSYQWTLGRAAMLSHTRTDNFEARGISVYDPATETVKLMGASDNGSYISGTWEGEGERVALKAAFTNAEGETGQMAIVYTKVDEKTMKISFHRVSDGENDPVAQTESTFRRKAVAKKKKAKPAPEE